MGRHQIRAKGLNNNEERDRLSFLPDNLLVTILSLMPVSPAVATSVLSRRWRYLWTHITHIFFDILWFYGDRFNNFQNSIATISSVISKLNSAKIHTFRIDFPFFKVQDQVFSILALSVHEICLRNPEVIYINIMKHNLKCYLSTSLLKTQSLVELKLHPTLEFDYAADAEIVINLPKLKILDVSLNDSHRHLMHTLFKSCPLLERLCLDLKFKENDHQLDIRAPNLKFLSIVGHETNYSLIIDAPQLVNLKMHGVDTLVLYHFVKKLKCLQEAEIILPPQFVGEGNNYFSRILDLLQNLSCARSLIFNRCFDVQFSEVGLPSFDNLANLSINGFHLGSNDWMPSCLLRNVKNIKIECIEPNDYGIRLLQGILSIATVLEQLQVSLIEYYGINPITRVGEEYEFAMKLFALPKSSPNCHINLSGRILTASSENFNDGQLYCKLVDRIERADTN